MDKRKKAYEESSLPYSFVYKIRAEFWYKNCPICNSIMKVGEFGDKSRIPTVQHNLPISMGGKHELGNISVICKKCNVSLKDTITPKLNADEVNFLWQKMCNG